MKILKAIQSQYLEKWHWCNGYVRINYAPKVEGTNIINVMNIKTIERCYFSYRNPHTDKWEENYEGSVIVMNDESGYVSDMPIEKLLIYLNKECTI